HDRTGQHQQCPGARVWRVHRNPGPRRVARDHGKPEREHDGTWRKDEIADAALTRGIPAIGSNSQERSAQCHSPPTWGSQGDLRKMSGDQLTARQHSRSSKCLPELRLAPATGPRTTSTAMEAGALHATRLAASSGARPRNWRSRSRAIAVVVSSRCEGRSYSSAH